MILGLEFVDPYVSAKVKKMIFVCVWFAFAFALFLLNRYHKRKTYPTIPDVKPWKIIVLLLCGFIGGLFTAVVGGGVDICSFSVLTLLFRVTEKTATPTSVVMMAWTSLVGLFWRRVIQESVTLQAWNYIIVHRPNRYVHGSFRFHSWHSFSPPSSCCLNLHLGHNFSCHRLCYPPTWPRSDRDVRGYISLRIRVLRCHSLPLASE